MTHTRLLTPYLLRPEPPCGEMMDGYKRLAAAVIEQALKDLRDPSTSALELQRSLSFFQGQDLDFWARVINVCSDKIAAGIKTDTDLAQKRMRCSHDYSPHQIAGRKHPGYRCSLCGTTRTKTQYKTEYAAAHPRRKR